MATEIIFWVAVATIGYSYLGYGLVLLIRSNWRPRPVRRAAFSPFITIVMVVRNEAAILERKLRNLMHLNYNAERLEVVIVSDGSTDGTNSILRDFVGPLPLQILVTQQSSGKASGINEAMCIASGEMMLCDC